MTIIHPKAFQRSPSAGFDGVFDWDFLLPAFAPTKIEPMDFDGVVERGGRFLCFETKSGIKPIPRGQVLTFERLVEGGLWTIIILRAKTASEISGWDVWFLGAQSREVEKRQREGNSEDLVRFVRRWFLQASRRAAA